MESRNSRARNNKIVWQSLDNSRYSSIAALLNSKLICSIRRIAMLLIMFGRGRIFRAHSLKSIHLLTPSFHRRIPLPIFSNRPRIEGYNSLHSSLGHIPRKILESRPSNRFDIRIGTRSIHHKVYYYHHHIPLGKCLFGPHISGHTTNPRLNSNPFGRQGKFCDYTLRIQFDKKFRN